MQSKYFKDKIIGELNASHDYMKKAIDSLKINPKWSYAFKVMSDDRYSHAEQLYKMFMELYLETDDQEAYLNSIRDAIIETFASKTRLIDGYKATYDLITGSEEPIEETEDERDNTE